MTQKERHEITRKRVRYMLASMDRVVRRQVPYRATGEATLDVYHPPDLEEGAIAPAVILVSGLSDAGAQQVLGCRINEMEHFVSWGQLLAASGVVGVSYTTGQDPAADAQEVLRYLLAHSRTIGIDTSQLGLFAVSSHVPNALGLLMTMPQAFRCAVLGYGYLLDLDGETGVAAAQRRWRFANPPAFRSVDDLPTDVPLFLARAGRDANPEVNRSIDAFVTHALRRNLPVTLVNHHRGAHAFDLDDDSETSLHIVEDILTFLKRHLHARP